MCLPLRASQWCTLEGEDTFDMGDATDRHQPIQHRVSPVKGVSMVHSLEGEDTFYMGDATDRRQPIHYRVSPVKSVSMVHPLKGEDTFDMGDATDRHQPLHYRVFPITRRTLHSFTTKLKLFIMT